MKPQPYFYFSTNLLAGHSWKFMLAQGIISILLGIIFALNFGSALIIFAILLGIMLLGCGVLTMLGIQTFMIVAGVIKMIPLTGVTMPFLSYGGSSLLSCMAMIGILHGASARAQENLEEDILCVRG